MNCAIRVLEAGLGLRLLLDVSILLAVVLLRVYFLIIISLVDSDYPTVLRHLFRLPYRVNLLLT